MTQSKREIKAFAFLTSDGKFVPDEQDSSQIYFKKPENRPNPFGYWSKFPWKPTRITISLPKKLTK